MYASGHLCIAPLTDKGLGFGSTLLYEIKRRKYHYNNNAKIREAVKLKDRQRTGNIPTYIEETQKVSQMFWKLLSRGWRGRGGVGWDGMGWGRRRLSVYFIFFSCYLG